MCVHVGGGGCSACVVVILFSFTNISHLGSIRMKARQTKSGCTQQVFTPDSASVFVRIISFVC